MSLAVACLAVGFLSGVIAGAILGLWISGVIKRAPYCDECGNYFTSRPTDRPSRKRAGRVMMNAGAEVLH